MAITLTEVLRQQLGGTVHKIFSIGDDGEDFCETVTLSMGALGMNFVKAAMLIPLSFTTSAAATMQPIMVNYESSAGGTDISMSTELTIFTGIIKVWGT